MEYEKIRSYEVSIWTLQDDFITVLKPSDLENKGQIEEGIARMNVDGTRELNFRIPMYIEPGVENPAWYNVRKGFIIANMRKIKVIFNKSTEDEYVLEFLITNVDETHENDQLYCEVKCEGLAFHELGKRGYKLSLTSDDYYMDDNVAAWYDGDSTYQTTHEEPIANIQYWLNKFITPLPENSDDINPNTWYYEICMDWSSLAATGLESNRIYDEEYATTWTTENNELVAASVMPPKEKSRLVDIEESNYYNITQQLAEIFGVFCKYVYEHDANYHITCRKVVFYNSFYSDKLGFLDFTYPYSAEQIKREIDSTDLVTKLYIKSVDDAQSASGLITILDTDANPSGEDYILNFDYLHDVNTINEEQYNQVKIFEATMHALNNQIVPINQRLAILENQVPKIQGELTVAKNGAQQDRERIEDANALFNSLTGETGTIHITATNPVSAVLLQDSSNTNKNYYYIKISEKGVDASTVKIYKTINYSNNTLSDELSGGVPQYDEYGNLNRINNLYATENSKKSVYLTYDYSPQLYSDNVKKVWERRLAKDEAEATALQVQLDVINNQITELKAQRDSLLTEKNNQLKLFEEEMGPAIREGYWQPENYTNYGNRLIDGLKIDISPLNGEIDCKTPYAKFIWDTEPFVGEQENGYKLGVDQQQQYYPCIQLTNEMIELIKNHLEELSFLFWDFDETPTYPHSANKLRSLPLGSQCQLAFIQSSTNNRTNNYPVILLTGEKIMANGTLAWMWKNGFIGKLTSHVDTTREPHTIVTEKEIYINNSVIANNWKNLPPPSAGEENPQPSSITVSYPRIQIDSLFLKNSTDELSISYNEEKLSPYTDYSVLTRDDKYYITLKPSALIRHGIVNKSLSFFYTLSTAATAIYLDALQVSRENAYPKVSYEIDPNVYGKDFMRTAYNTLANLAHINDSELKFDGVMGYISEVELNLDKPWEDKIEIKNYKNKFEDLFSTIVAQTEAIKNAQPILTSAAQVLTLDGTLSSNAVQDIIRHADLDYAFNNGQLTIDNENGIWGTSDSGVVAFRGGGIFTATERNEEGIWKWNTGITPEGINADLITTGQLDTNRINIYAGDNIRLQLNKDGLFAYKSYLFGSKNNDPEHNHYEYDIDEYQIFLQSNDNNNKQNYSDIIGEGSNGNKIVDKKQYVRFNEDGLFLIAEQGAPKLQVTKTQDGENVIRTYDVGELSQTVRRVEISWDGLKLRNWSNDEVFFADANTGDLTLKGSIEATDGHIGGWKIGTTNLSGTNVELISSGDEAGIKVTNVDVSRYTVEYNNQTYNSYRQGNNVYYYYTNSGSYPSTLTVDSDNINNIIKQQSYIVKVQPIKVVSKQLTRKIEQEVPDPDDPSQTEIEKIDYEYTQYFIARSDDTLYVKNNSIVLPDPSDESYAAKYEDRYLIYNQSDDPQSSWYTTLMSDGNNTPTWVNITTALSDEYGPVTTTDLPYDTELTRDTYNPTLSIAAKTGYLTATNGKLGNFDLTSSGLNNGNLTNSTITGGTIQGKKTTQFLRAFVDLEANGSAGTYTLTRIDGTKATFNITTMLKYQSDMAVNYQTGWNTGYSGGYNTGYSGGYSNGKRDKTVSSLSDITLSSSDTGTSSQSVTITYNDGSSGSKNISVNASAVYTAGRNNVGLEADAENAVVVTVNNSSTKSIAITAGNGAINYNSSTHKYSTTHEAYAGNALMSANLVYSGTEAWEKGQVDGYSTAAAYCNNYGDATISAATNYTLPTMTSTGTPSTKTITITPKKVTVTASASTSTSGSYTIVTSTATGSNGETDSKTTYVYTPTYTFTSKSITSNGTYSASSDGYSGYTSVTVSVPGDGHTYTPAGSHYWGYSNNGGATWNAYGSATLYKRTS